MRSSPGHLLLISLFVCFYPACIYSQEYKSDGHELMDMCSEAVKLLKEEVHDTYKAISCVRFIEGFRAASAAYVSANEAGFDENGTMSWKLCDPHEVTNGQVIRLVAGYLNDHPEELNTAAGILVAEAIQNTYPCSDRTD